MLRLFKRLLLVLFLIFLVASAALYVLYFRRAPLPATSPHARIAPVITTIPGFAA